MQHRQVIDLKSQVKYICIKWAKINSGLVRRSKVFEDSYLQISALDKNEIKTARQRLWIDFEGEDSQDYGGVAREVSLFM